MAGEDSRAALKKEIHDSNEILAKASTIFMFPKTIVSLTRAKLIIEKRSPLGGADVVSLGIDDIANVNATVGPLFGTTMITTKLTGSDHLYKVGLFWRKDTIRLKRIIQGYIAAIHKEIDLSVLPIDELKALLYELGTDDHSIK